MYALLAIVLLPFITLLVRADNWFLFPPPAGVNVTLGSTNEIQWTTNWGSVPISLAVYQADPDSSWLWESSILLDSVVDPGSYAWTAEALGELPITNGFHFTVWLGSSSDNHNDSSTINSGTLFINEDAATTSVASLPYPSKLPLSTIYSTSASQSAIFSMASSSGFKTVTSSTQPHPSPTITASPSGTSLPTTGGRLGNAANITTIVGSVIGGVVACLTLLLTWLGFRKNKKGNRVLPAKMRELHRNLSQRRRWQQPIAMPLDGQDVVYMGRG